MNLASYILIIFVSEEFELACVGRIINNKSREGVVNLSIEPLQANSTPVGSNFKTKENPSATFVRRLVASSDVTCVALPVDDGGKQKASFILKLSKCKLKSQLGFPCLKHCLESEVRQNQLNLSDEKACLAFMQRVKGYNAEVLKKSRWKNDAMIFKLTGVDGGSRYSVKIHPDVFPLCSHIYCNDTVDKINSSGATTRIIDTFTVCSEKRSFRVVVYEFLDGTPLRKAMAENKIERESAISRLIELERKLSAVKTYLVLRDQNDFLLLESGHLVLTDWNAIVDVPNASMESLNGYADFKAGCIRDFMMSAEEYDKR